jgi:hypothetical protein
LGDAVGAVRATIRWPGGFTQTVENLTRHAVTQVPDMTNPSINARTISFTYEVGPGKADWIFTWDTAYSCNPALDQVTVSYRSGNYGSCYFPPQVLTPTTPGVEAKVVARVGPNSGYRHTLKWLNRDCTVGCSYNYSVRSATSRNVVSEVGGKVATIGFCLVDPGEQ